LALGGRPPATHAGPGCPESEWGKGVASERGDLSRPGTAVASEVNPRVHATRAGRRAFVAAPSLTSYSVVACTLL